jgi:hypothetical protein
MPITPAGTRDGHECPSYQIVNLDSQVLDFIGPKKVSAADTFARPDLTCIKGAPRDDR